MRADCVRLVALRRLHACSLRSSRATPSVAPLSAALSTSAARHSGTKAAGISPLRTGDEFLHRHLGPREAEIGDMLKVIGDYKTLDELTAATVPNAIRLAKELVLAPPATESEALAELKAMASKNNVLKSMIGMGYYDTLTPGVIARNILENPGWYTSYTPYQAEISQGRLESLLNFQTMIVDMTGMHISNASLLDEATAAAEAMNLAHGQHSGKRTKFFIADDVHPQTIETIRTRASGMGIEVVVGTPVASTLAKTSEYSGILLQYPSTYGVASAGTVEQIVAAAKQTKTLVITATDLLALTLIKSPGDLGADIAVGSAQRFGVPMGFGGPHAGFLATKKDFQRRMPGRIIGVSVDAQGNRALRMAMQTREQHIRRDKATSNICTAQALLANMAAMYAVYHGPDGLRAIAWRVHALAHGLGSHLLAGGFSLASRTEYFDTLSVSVPPGAKLSADAIVAAAVREGVNLRRIDASTIGISLDEKTTGAHLLAVLRAFGLSAVTPAALEASVASAPALPASLARTSPFLTHPVFNTHRSETQLLRYLHKLEMKDLSLNYSMISLGSCTMKLNATSEMVPVSWPEFTDMHPFAPAEQTAGYRELISSLSSALCTITGFAAASMQPNSGAAGEYAGLMAIRAFHAARGEAHRDVCLIPVSAHGTNPASAVMAGMRVVVVDSDEAGNVDFADLVAKAEAHAANLGALMITYPSTYGVFEERIRDFCALVHGKGGQVYMDGANMNAQVALTSPGEIGADVCHLNLHKTFCIPHGGGGPGVGTIAVAKHLAPYLPGHPVVPTGGDGAGVVAKKDLTMAAAPYGSALILPISWMYIRMLGAQGLKKATQTAILNANYLAARLAPHYNIVFKGSQGRCAHEFIIDLRPFKAASGGALGEEDVAKRLMDYGFHSPTMSWPVGGTLMIEPTESEDRAELDRFAEALISIRHEIEDVISGRVAAADSPLTHAPHTAAVISADTWDRAYSRTTGAFPAKWVKESKFWPTVSRINNVYGDRNLVCSCPPLENYK